MKIFLDTEFTGLSQKAELISLAMVSERGEQLYIEFNDIDLGNLNQWIKENVIPHLEFATLHRHYIKQDTRLSIKTDKRNAINHIKKWLNNYDVIEMWADVSFYDWVLFCELFGGSLYLPQNLSFICYDLATLLHVRKKDIEALGISTKNNESTLLHHALYDAEHGMKTLKLISEYGLL